jgi:hypothetical protein
MTQGGRKTPQRIGNNFFHCAEYREETESKKSLYPLEASLPLGKVSADQFYFQRLSTNSLHQILITGRYQGYAQDKASAHKLINPFHAEILFKQPSYVSRFL